MNVNELFPIASGVLLALLLLRLRPALRPWVGAFGSVLGGAAATISSHEFQLNWGFVLVDTALVAGAAVAALLLLDRLALRRTA